MQSASVAWASARFSRGRPPTKGDEIRARIEANRLKRLAIAEAMKAEAGVTRHDLNREGEGGLAFIGTGVILSPEGRNMRQLYIVAHECGHIFLHNDGEGYLYPGHLKEMEAESYAHQAFREHGMRLPADLTRWGRQYVGSWIEKDRAAGIRIDPRAEAYAVGARSPYEPLRMVPDTWNEAVGLPTQLPATARADAAVAPATSARPLSATRRESGALLEFAFNSFIGGSGLCAVGLWVLRDYGMLPDWLTVSDPFTKVHPWAWLTGGLLASCLATSLRVASVLRPDD
ncbi:MAG: hypothetical protein R3D27_08240 [Hyphomicrobiaceae bacterium]